MKKYPSIRYPGESATDGLLAEGEDIVVMEKLDGANFRFKFEDGELVVGSRNVEYESADDPNLDKNFEHAVEYLKHKFEGVDTSKFDSLTFYGEAMHKHTIDYDAYEGDHPHPTEEGCPNVVLFDVAQEGAFVHHDTFMDIVAETPLDHAPILDRQPASEFDGMEIPTSAFRTPDDSADDEFHKHGLAEGLVYKRADGTVRAKKVHPTFKENHTGGPSGGDHKQTAAGEFVSKYVTKARIRKIAHKLVERPDSTWDGLQMEMMEDLPREVLVDAMEENAWDLLNNDFECEFDSDFKSEVRSKASKKCARVLKEEIQTL